MNIKGVVFFYVGMYAIIGLLYYISPILCGVIGAIFSIWIIWGVKVGGVDPHGEDKNDTGNW
jgi:hypothetical protein